MVATKAFKRGRHRVSQRTHSEMVPHWSMTMLDLATFVAAAHIKERDSESALQISGEVSFRANLFRRLRKCPSAQFLRGSTQPKTFRYSPTIQGVVVDRLRSAVGTFRNVIVARWACKLLKMWWPETGSNRRRRPFRAGFSGQNRQKLAKLRATLGYTFASFLV
jgi:hypothetical protein